eukprot:CAMPEP_0170569692 /NCGR_PEP_ID=MMETSP0224-20130122/698_1 /TAXON_ID=285029 /ORGANISM="Togula jolla, Strain CCCM 725" /LENGTH=433 /DNA_ID=CAMNT_0010891891 /DNA_START=176 /DNA_END=1474 /DNA_ORIENTATION=+
MESKLQRRMRAAMRVSVGALGLARRHPKASAGRRVAQGLAVFPEDFDDPDYWGAGAFPAPPELPEAFFDEDFQDRSLLQRLGSYSVGSLDDYLSSYNSLMADSAWIGDWQTALEVLADMPALGVYPNETSYYVAITACRRGGNWQKACDLLEEMFNKDMDPDVLCFTAVIASCFQAGETEMGERLREELRERGPAPEAERFHSSPMMKWNRQVRRFGCGMRNVHSWKGEHHVPETKVPCWFLPNQDDLAVHVAEHQAALRRAGWKVLSCHPDVARMLGNKSELRKHVVSLGLADFMPRHFSLPEEAVYPCILKPAIGTFGKDTHIVRSKEDVLGIIGGTSLSQRWLLQELIPGRIEFSTTMLVIRGEVFDIIGIRYEYDGEEYVWPNVREVSHEYVSVPADHKEIFRQILADFSGICCVGYKLRADGKLCLFE